MSRRSRLLSVVSPQRGRAMELARLQKAGRVSVGPGTYGTPRLLTFEDDSTRLSIGNYTSIAEGVTILLGGNHPTDRLSTFPFRLRYSRDSLPHDGYPSTKGDIQIGSDVWIGYSSTILSGVTIGHGAVIAAGSVVVGEVAPYSIVGGIPAKPIGARASEKEIETLLSIAWWDWEESTILEHTELLNSRKSPETLARLQAVHETLFSGPNPS